MKIRREIIKELRIHPDMEKALMGVANYIAEQWIRDEYNNRFDKELVPNFQYWEPTTYKNMKEKRAMGLAV